MDKITLRKIILKYSITRELFFFVGKRKVNKRKIDKNLKNMKHDSRAIIDGLIVSLTSYGERINELKYTLYSLVIQTIKPEIIVVNIALKDKMLIADELHKFENYGVLFNYCDDLSSFKKLIPTMQYYNNKVIVTCDDDVLYEKNWLEILWRDHIRFPNMIIAHNIHRITYNEHNIEPYEKWIHSIKNEIVTDRNFFVGCGGVLYPPNCLYNDYANVELFLKLTPLADDIWFYFMAILNNTRIKQPKHPHLNFRYVNPYREYGLINGKTLTQENVGFGRNDEQFYNVLRYYNIDMYSFIKRLEYQYN